jgi:hypothetical protein
VKILYVEKISKMDTILLNAHDAFKTFKNDNKPIFNHLNYNWYFILAYLGDGALKLKNMIKSDTFLRIVLNNNHP